jgi:hypothetical protein
MSSIEDKKKEKIINFYDEAIRRGRKIADKKKSTISQSIKGGRGHIQLGVIGNTTINFKSQKTSQINIPLPENSIGADLLLRQRIKELFNKIGEAREKRGLGRGAYGAMYKTFKRKFGIKNNPWTIIWTWPKEYAQTIIDYLEEKYNNTITGRTEKVAKRKDYIHPRKHLYRIERELLGHLGYDLNSPEVKQLLKQYFGVSSHTELSHLQHWEWVKYLEGVVKRIEESGAGV